MIGQVQERKTPARYLETLRVKYAENAEFREAIKTKHWERYHSDPEYRQECLRKQRERYRLDADFRQRMKDDAKRNTQQRSQWFVEYRSTLVCEECGEARAPVLDFHHMDPTQKSFPVTLKGSQGYPKDLVMAEIAKCRVLCANCHRMLHWTMNRDPRNHPPALDN